MNDDLFCVAEFGMRKSLINLINKSSPDKNRLASRHETLSMTDRIYECYNQAYAKQCVVASCRFRLRNDWIARDVISFWDILGLFNVCTASLRDDDLLDLKSW